MAKITTLDGMRNYIKLALGAPVVNIELHDTQIDQVIEDECMTFARYNYHEGNYEDYIVFQPTLGVSDYPVSGIYDLRTSAYVSDVLNVYDFASVSFLDNINVLFSPQHILLHEEFVTRGAYPGGPGSVNLNDGLTLTNYNVAQIYLKEVNKMFGKSYGVRYLPGLEIIRIVPTPITPCVGVLVLNRKLPDSAMYNNPIVKRLCVAKAKIWWGNNLSKYNGSLPDGLSINGEGIKSQGQEEYASALDDCRAESEPCDFFIG